MSVESEQLEKDREDAARAHEGEAPAERLRRLQSEAHPKSGSIERILLSASTALDAGHCWYVEAKEGREPRTDHVTAALEDCEPRYAAGRDHTEGTYERRFSSAPSQEAFPVAPLTEQDLRDPHYTIIVPVMDGDHAKGFAVFTRSHTRDHGAEGPFTGEERELARFMVQEQADYFTRPHVAAARDVAFEKQLQFLDGLDSRLHALLRTKSENQGGHVERVADLYENTLRELMHPETMSVPIPLNIDIHPTEDQLKVLRYAARLHDADKGQVASFILNHPGRLEFYMKVRMDMHPWQSADIIDVPLLDKLPIDIYPIIENHHMNLVGQGYPNDVLQHPLSPYIDTERSTNEMIVVKPMDPYTSVLTIVDQFEAITGNRSYHKHRPGFQAVEKALKHLYDLTSEGKVEPELFIAFINSKALKTYLEEYRVQEQDAPEQKTYRHLLINDHEMAVIHGQIEKYNEQLREIDRPGRDQNTLPPLAAALVKFRHSPTVRYIQEHVQTETENALAL